MKSVRKSQPSRQGRWLWTVLLLVGFTQTVAGVVDVTIVSKFQFFDESADTWLSCYHTSSILNQNGFQFGVEVNTGSGTDFTGQRYSFEETGVRSVNILDSAGNFRVGAFSCRVSTSDGSQIKKAITFKMKSQADVWPVTFTVTANTGDPVTLQMVQKSNRTGTLEWRKDGLDGTVLTGQNGLSLTIASVQSSDEGIYECYYQGDTDRKQGIMRLIVRGCTENKWGPPSCTGDCPVCYNGGVCDDNTGECVCPPGFNGTNCESACANNKIGTSCRECIGGDCIGQLLCVMDPYGCSCGPGLMGIECNTVCPDGMYGAGCTQTCHCASGGSVCDVSTGVCSSGGCEAGWKGSNCQTACIPGEFGPDCNGTCHCASGDSVCDIRTGVCSSGGCEAGWEGNNCQEECSGAYGHDCTISCGNCYGSQACDRFNGTCPTEGDHVCAAGYHGDKCHQECSPGAYGPDCDTTCGHCYQGHACYRFDGTCPTGGTHVCAAGYHGDNCHQECSNTYGPGCGTNCGHCYQGQTCNRFNGTCPTGDTHVCAAGYHGNNCHQECLPGAYGPDCTLSCGHCYGGPICDRVNGICPTGGSHVCAAGYQGDNCHQECSPGAYGPDCDTTCGHCYLGSHTCDKFVGTCPTGGSHVCAAGYHGDNCHQEQPATVHIAPIVGGSVAALIVVIVLVTVGIICHRKRNTKDDQGLTGLQIGMESITKDEPPNNESADNPTCTALDEDSSPYETTIYSRADLVTVDDVVEFLRAKGLGQYVGVFRNNKVDGEGALSLTSELLAELVPEIGPRAKLQKALSELMGDPESTESNKPVHSDWEIPRSSLTLGKVLGKGQFGEVRLGELRKRGVTQTVAVKTLKEFAGDKDKEDLIGELDILVTVGRHDNIISLVGACTVEGPLVLVVEYAPNGCLKDWLKDNRPEELNQTDIPSSGIQLPMDQLIMFGIDIANGMSHLAAMQCVHRDLATRNVLLGKNLTAKISDFGLSRDIYEESEYVTSTKSQLPVRWLAYESLFYHVYTTQSDVWSFGILLWEIMTMGKKPYGKITGKELMKLFPTGYRLEKPALCPQDVYDVMKSCWETQPENRPTFPQLKATLDRIIQDHTAYASLLK